MTTVPTIHQAARDDSCGRGDDVRVGLTRERPLPVDWRATALSITWLGLGFFLPFSTAGVSVFVAALLVQALGRWRDWRMMRPWAEPVILCGFVLWLYVLVRTWPADAVSVAAVHHYRELLLLPVFWVLLSAAAARFALVVGLLLGASFMAGLYVLNATDCLPHAGLSAWLAQRRISAGFILALCAFLAWEIGRRRLRHARALQALGLGLAAAVLFCIDGRTAHLVLLVLVVCAGFRSARGRRRWMLVGLVTVVLLGLAAMSDKVRTRLDETKEATTVLRQGGSVPTSSGIRYEIWRNALGVVEAHPIAGTGWGSAYARAFWDADDRHGNRLDPAFLPSPNPHSEFLFQWGAGGVTALVLFGLWLALPLWRALARPVDADAGALACVTLAFAVGCTVNSMLWDFAEAHAYVVLLALGLRQPPYLAGPPTDPRPEPDPVL